MLENENLENEELDEGFHSEEENLEEEDNLDHEDEESDDEPPQKKESFISKIRKENRELKKQLKAKESKPNIDQDTEMRFFFLENPELKEDKEGIIETMAEHPTLTPLQAHALYKAEKPKKSESKSESFKGGSYKPKPKKPEEMTLDEAEKNLHGNDWLKYIKATGAR